MTGIVLGFGFKQPTIDRGNSNCFTVGPITVIAADNCAHAIEIITGSAPVCRVMQNCTAINLNGSGEVGSSRFLENVLSRFVSRDSRIVKGPRERECPSLI